MDSRRVQQIMAVYRPYGINILKGTKDDRRGDGWSVVGFDSEYNSKTDTLISYQLAHAMGGERFIAGPKRLSIREIAEEAFQLDTSTKRVLIASYFNTAELSQLATNFWDDTTLKVYPAHPSGILHIQGKTDTYEFFYFDLWHWFASMANNSLYAVAALLGFEKVDWHREGQTHEQSISTLTQKDARSEAFRNYAIHDARLCVQIFGTLDNTYREINRTSIVTRPTPANASQASFRRNYLRANVRPASQRVRTLALKANWGGRAECGYVGSHDAIYEHDADSLYPRSTLLLPNLPAGMDWFMGLPDDWYACEGFIDVDFRFPDDEEWPNLPVFSRGSLIFPTSGRSACTIGEVRAALERGCQLTHIYEACFYRRGKHDEFHSFLRNQLALKDGAGDNQALRAVAKLNMNSAIGKFVQHKGGFNYNKVSKYVIDNGISDTDIILGLYAGVVRPDNGEQFSEPIRLGASFYPEWHTLILGKAREVVARAIFQATSYPRVLTVATDAVYIPDAAMPQTMVPFTRKRGPMRFIPFRVRRHLSLDPETYQPLAVAHHGMPLKSWDAAFMMALSEHNERIAVQVQGMHTAREAIKRGKRFGEAKSRSLMIDMSPDVKRVVDDAGWTHPHKDVSGHLAMIGV